MKDLIKEILIEFHQDELPNVIKRAIDIPKLPSTIRKAFIFIGMRRVGKTFLMYQHMENLIANGLDKRKLIYINFEDDRLASFKVDDFQTILDVYFELYPDFIHNNDLHFFFDEIQNILDWEKFIRRLLDKEKMSIYITGSSAKLLSKEIATSLRGRCLTKEIFPLSFSEFLNYNNIRESPYLTSKDKSVIKHYCHNYLTHGGFPETLQLSENLRRQTIQSYINAAVFRDVIERYNLSNSALVKTFLNHCLQNIAAPLSVTKLYKTLKSLGETATKSNLYMYLKYFEDAYLLATVPLFDYSARKRQVNPSKVYCVDSGIIGAYSIKIAMEYSHCLENAVYIYLRKKEYEGIYYYKTHSGKEIDFVAQSLNGQIELFQVCVELSDEKTKQREITALVEAANELHITHARIITSDTTEHYEINNITIDVIPYWQWSINYPPLPIAV